MADTTSILHEQFDSLEQQQETSTVGMWVFLATEVLFFGGLFMGYVVFRTTYPRDFATASHHTDLLLGTLNTAVLLTSSLGVALAVRAAQLGERKWIIRFLMGTIALGIVFLALKGLEYNEHIADGLFPGRRFRKELGPHVELFFWLYFVMTGLHALHVLIGILLLSAITLLASRGNFSKTYYNPVEVSGLYWHFVDIVWVFLYPLFYLIHR